MKKYIITGLLIWIPLVITLWVLKLIVGSLDQVLLERIAVSAPCVFAQSDSLVHVCT